MGAQLRAKALRRRAPPRAKVKAGERERKNPQTDLSAWPPLLDSFLSSALMPASGLGRKCGRELRPDDCSVTQTSESEAEDC